MIWIYILASILLYPIVGYFSGWYIHKTLLKIDLNKEDVDTWTIMTFLFWPIALPIALGVYIAFNLNEPYNRKSAKIVNGLKLKEKSQDE